MTLTLIIACRTSSLVLKRAFSTGSTEYEVNVEAKSHENDMLQSGLSARIFLEPSIFRRKNLCSHSSLICIGEYHAFCPLQMD